MIIMYLFNSFKEMNNWIFITWLELTSPHMDLNGQGQFDEFMNALAN